MTSVTDIWGLQPALDSKAPIAHRHKVADVDGLKDTLLSIQNAIFEGGNSGPILISSVEGLSGELDGKAAIGHTHSIDQVTGLAIALDGKADSDHTHPPATTSAAGLMSPADKTKLDGLGSGGGGASTIAEVEGLQAALDGKASTAHTHSGLITLSPALLTYTISQSSLYPGSTAGTYENLTDGLFTTGTGTNYTGGTETITADMGSVQVLSRLSVSGGIVPGFGDTTTMLNTSTVEVSEDGSSWIIVVPSIVQCVNNARTSFSLGQIAARYLRVRRSGNHCGLATLMIYG